MQEKCKLLIALYNELKEEYEYYLEKEYNENAHFDANEDHNPEFDNWTDKNCLSFDDWTAEYADENVTEILNVLKSLSEEVKR